MCVYGGCGRWVGGRGLAERVGPADLHEHEELHQGAKDEVCQHDAEPAQDAAHHCAAMISVRHCQQAVEWIHAMPTRAA